MTPQAFITAAMANPHNPTLLDRLATIRLPQCHLTAGCLFQTIWNQTSNHPPDWGIKDYDVFYFDDTDLSYEAEDRAIQRLAEATADLPIHIQLRNQARVHLWYADRFGGHYPQLNSAQAGIDRYLIACTCIGIEARTRTLYAPNGLADLASGLLRMNPANPRPDLFRNKAESYRQRWPWLTIA